MLKFLDHKATNSYRWFEESLSDKVGLRRGWELGESELKFQVHGIRSSDSRKTICWSASSFSGDIVVLVPQLLLGLDLALDQPGTLLDFSALLMFKSAILVGQLTEVRFVPPVTKVLAWKSGGVKFWTNLMSASDKQFSNTFLPKPRLAGSKC